ncbi:MAG: hypothetical protein IJ218_06610 [Alphaproteobacteria bacterium]|nr:hypothetical protein [Alphaproteobacteria bacterium]
MQKNKIMAVILKYEDFIRLSTEKRAKMLAEECVEWRVYIPPKQMGLLSMEEKTALKGFVVTHNEPIKIKTYEKKDLFPEPKEIPELIDRKTQERFAQKAQRKHLKRIVPLKMGIINAKKKGGR